MDDIPEDEIISIVKDHFKAPNSTTSSKQNEFSAPGSFSVGTMKTFYTISPSATTDKSMNTAFKTVNSVNQDTKVKAQKAKTPQKKIHLNIS